MHSRSVDSQGCHLSTIQAIRLLEEHGINTEDSHLQAPSGLLKKTTVNRYLKQRGYDKERLSRQPPAVRFEAKYSNQCWHFDLSSSNLKRLKNLEKELDHLGFLTTEAQTHLEQEITKIISQGRLIAL